MQNNYNYRFKYFDPKIGELPDPYAVIFVEVTYRARKILESFSAEDICLAAPGINKIIRDKAFIDPLSEDLKKESIKTLMYGQEYEIIPSTNDIEAIYQNIGRVDLTRHIDLLDFSWPQLFAIITLHSSELLLEQLNYKATWKPGMIFPAPTEAQILNNAYEYHADARQAITFAEMLIDQEINQRRILSEQNRKAANARHEKGSNQLKDAVISKYKENFSKRSNRDAAAKILTALAEEGRLTFDADSHKLVFDGLLALQTDEPEHRFAIWIGKYKKTGE